MNRFQSISGGRQGQRIAIVGAGVSGLTAAHLLHPRHDITVFEAGDYAGGHSNTVEVYLQGRSYPLDTGFMVFNERTYPHFIALLERLGVTSREAEMSFSVQVEASGLEYCGTNLNTVFAQRRNLLRPSFLRMLRQILRFNREGRAWLAEMEAHASHAITIQEQTLAEWLQVRGYARELMEHYVLPMGAAIWSAEPEAFADMPALTFFRFFENHGLLSVAEQPTWRTIVGGSREYVRRLSAPFAEQIRLNSPVQHIQRTPRGVHVKAVGRTPETFDHVVLACHSDQALRMLADPSRAEREILGAIRYQPNECVLHTDTRLLPRNPRARASWNYHLATNAGGEAVGATVTYDLARLQGHDAPEPLLLTLNRSGAIDPARILRRLDYAHPLLDAAAVAAQSRRTEIDGANRTSYCGAYWGYGFHEDGVRSAFRACAPLLQEQAA